MGFGQSSAFGGPIKMPTVDRLANEGLRYNEFHTTALCSPTRSALLSGRNHHMNNMGSITETATTFPGQTGQRPNSVATVAEMLRLNGYSTAAFRQEPRDRGVGSQPVRPDRPLADPLGLRQVLRLHRRRDQPVGAAALRRHDPGRAVEGSELSLHDRHDQQGDRLDAVPEVADAGQAVLHVLRAGRHPRAASRAEGMDRQVQGQVRPGLGQAARGDAGAADQARRRARRTPSSRPSRKPSRTGPS